MAEQLALTFEASPAVDRRRAWMLSDEIFGNHCPACRAQPGELCKSPQKAFGRDGERDDWSTHGMRSRFARPGHCLGRCPDPEDCWGCEP